jgi:hypothetical protein
MKSFLALQIVLTHDDYDLHKEGDLKLLLEGLKDMERVKCLIHL